MNHSKLLIHIGEDPVDWIWYLLPNKEVGSIQLTRQINIFEFTKP